MSNPYAPENVILQGYGHILPGSQAPVYPVYAIRPAQIQAFFDDLASVLKAAYGPMGLGLPSETTSIAHAAQVTRAKLMGDGTVLYPGLGSPQWQSQISQYVDLLAFNSRYDTFFAGLVRPLIAAMELLIEDNLPSGWTYVGPGGVASFLDAHLIRLNAASAVTPATPTDKGVSTAGYDQFGAMPSTISGSEPYVSHSLVGALDYMESLPAVTADRVAIAGTSNSYIYQIPGTVPDGVIKVQLYRSVYGASVSDPLYWIMDVNVAAGDDYPAIPLRQPDSLLRQDWSPPSWLSCLMVPEAAALIGLAYAVVNTGPGGTPQPLRLNPLTMLSATNAVLGPSSGYVGLGNPVQSAIFGITDLSSGFVEGEIASENYADLNVQGFLGGIGVQARVTSALNGTRVPRIEYMYYDAAHGFANPQMGGPVAPTINFTSTGVGGLATYMIPAGQIVLSVTEADATGSATAGIYLYESTIARPY